jgi:hypothetical protein
MSGTVGQSGIRTDARQAILDRTPKEIIPSLIEDGGRIRAAKVVEPRDRARTTEVGNILDFYKLLKKVLETATEMDGTSFDIRMTLDYPPEDAVLPCFQVSLLNRVPFQARGTQEISPRFMQEYEDPNFPGEIVREYLTRQQNTIQVTIWAKTNKEAYRLSEWLEEVFQQYLWALKWGVTPHPIRWDGRDKDIYEQEREQQMYGCPHMFTVVTEKITKKRITAIRKLAIEVGLLIEHRPDDLTPAR